MRSTTSHTPVENIDRHKLAVWPPSTETRTYDLADGRGSVPRDTTGRNLPAKQIVGELNQVDDDFHKNLLESVRLFIDIPPAFFEAYLHIQLSRNPIRLPRIMQNKNITVFSCLAQHDAFTSAYGVLNPDRWEALGWNSLAEYRDWLNTSMLFAFSHCSHYCSAPRVFEADEEQNQTSGELFHFKQVMTDARSPQKKTNILSVTGFEYRNYVGSIDDTLPEVKKHSKISMQQILAAALQTDTTDVVLIPFGMGVFLPQGANGERVKEFMFQGMVEALREYDGPLITMHCCGWPDFYHRLNSSANANINFQNKSGYDAYTIANEIQDRGDAGQMQENVTNVKPLKSMLINAADNDWTALLDPGKVPGQFSDNHTLFDRTSDEYYALVMAFAYFSVQRIVRFFWYYLERKIVQIVATPSDIQEETEEVENGNISCLSADQIQLIDNVIRQLESEINSSWPYPNKDRKQHKVDGLNALKNYAVETDDISEAIARVETEFTDIRKGRISNRTDTLLTQLAMPEHGDHARFRI